MIMTTLMTANNAELTLFMCEGDPQPFQIIHERSPLLDGAYTNLEAAVNQFLKLADLPEPYEVF